MTREGLRTAILTAAIGLLWGCMAVDAQGLDPTFKPELVAAEFTSREIRPGDLLSMTLKFRNAGTRPAKGDYRIFVHFEAPEQDCTNIVMQLDHDPSLPTALWRPGEVVLDGPETLSIPKTAVEREYFVHVGVFDTVGTGERILDTYAAGKITVSANAPPSQATAPAALPEEELARRRQALVERIPAQSRLAIDRENWRFDMDRLSGVWGLTDKRTGAVWASAPDRPRFAQVMLRDGDETAAWRAETPDSVRQDGNTITAVTTPRVNGRGVGVTVTFTFAPTENPDGLRVSYEARSTGPWKVTRVRLLDGALWCTDAESGVVYVPHRLGIEMKADAGLPRRKSFRTYDSLSMAMCGAVKDGSALLVNWDDVDTNLSVDGTWPDLPVVPGRRMQALSLDIDAPQGACTLHPIGEGGYVQIAQAYRRLAKQKGWRQTWAEKRAQFPTVDRMFGAANFKPFVFSRVLPTSRYGGGKESTHLGFTFDEVAQCAEHWRNDLGIDKAYVVMAGWINGGYDVRHPDPLPATPECGGNEAMKAAFDRIKACGYLVGGHDNYQDMYEDAPSWSVEALNKDARGNPRRGGNWNGGQAWQVCAIRQVDLAARPQTNLPEIAHLFSPTVFFIDTVFAWPLVTCEDPNHPMTRQDDLEWKTRLCMLAKEHFGMFGSEEGREWAVPCADYLEGIFGHQTDSAPGDVIPLLPLVYSDCVQIMTHQGDRIGPGDEKKMADHVLFAEMHLPRFGEHLYWTREEGSSALPLAALAPRVRYLGDRKLEITYRWRVEGKVANDYRIFVHFCNEASERPEGISFQDDQQPDPPMSQWQPGSIHEIGPRIVEIPEGVTGPCEIRLGVLGADRVALAHGSQQGLRYLVGSLDVSAAAVQYTPAEEVEQSEIWSRADGGWAEGLCATDRVIKNTWEVLSPLNTITAERPLDSHEFLSPDRRLQRTRFGDLTITVAYEKPSEFDGCAVPAYGFVIESPGYVAFCAKRYNGLDYATPALFTARSLDGKPIAESSQVRIYHGFGDARIRLAGKEFTVAREEVVSVR